MISKIYPQNPNEKEILRIASMLSQGDVIIYPTDTLYAFGCSLNSAKAIEKLQQVSGKQGNDLSIICSDLSEIATYARVDNNTFKLLKRNLPGPFTFILNASGKVPDKYLSRKKTVGIRIPDNEIALSLVRALGAPLVTASLNIPPVDPEYGTDPQLMQERYGNQVAVVIDGGYGHTTPSTIVDCTGDEPIVTRQGNQTLEQ